MKVLLQSAGTSRSVTVILNHPSSIPRSAEANGKNSASCFRSEDNSRKHDACPLKGLRKMTLGKKKPDIEVVRSHRNGHRILESKTHERHDAQATHWGSCWGDPAVTDDTQKNLDARARDRRAYELFIEAIELAPEARTPYLREQCGTDELLLKQVTTLLQSHDETSETNQAETSKAQPNPMIGKEVGRYTIRKVLGEGGMGVVYEAIQKSPRRTVALKMIRRNVTSRSALRRFEYEAQTLGRLQHEGIAHIFEADTLDEGHGPQPWFAMEYIVGAKTLTEYCSDKKLGTRKRLELFKQICRAVQHGHSKGIIHRDLKPSNILVTANGVAKIIDFGVARSIDSDLVVTTLQTDIGALIGTLQYMSPEQCEGDSNAIDTRSDVYALGVILYEMLCNKLPYDVRKKAIHEVARMIREDEPTRPSTYDKRFRGDLEVIAMKALEKDRERRYQSTLDFENDISRYLAGDTILAKRASSLALMTRFAKRHKATAAALVATISVTILAAVVTMVFYLKTIESENKNTEAANKLEKLNEQTRILNEQKRVDSEKNEKKIQELRAASMKRIRESYRDSIQRAQALVEGEFNAAEIRKELAEARTHRKDSLAEEFIELNASSGNSDTEQMLEWLLLNEQADTSIHTIRQTAVDERGITGDVTPINFIFSPKGTYLAVAYDNGDLYLYETRSWNTKSDTPLRKGKSGRIIQSINFSGNEERIAITTSDNSLPPEDTEVFVLETDTGEELLSQEKLEDLTTYRGEVMAALSHDGKKLAWITNTPFLGTGGSREILTIIDVDKKEIAYEEETRFDQHHKKMAIWFSPIDPKALCIVSNATFRKLESSDDEYQTIRRLNLSPRGKNSTRASARITKGVTVSANKQHFCLITQRDGKVNLSQAHIWDIPSLNTKAIQDEEWEPTKTIEAPARFTNHELALNKDGTRLAMVSDTAIEIWNTADRVLESEIAGSSQNLAFSPNHDFVAAISNDDVGDGIKIWRCRKRSTDTIEGHEYAALNNKIEYGNLAVGIQDVAFSRDGAMVAISEISGQISIWDAVLGQHLATLTPSGTTDNPPVISKIAFNQTGTLLAAVENYLGNKPETKVRLWNLSSGQDASTLADTGTSGPWKLSRARVKDIAFSKNDDKILIAHNGVTAIELATGEMTHEVKSLTTSDFSSDGKFISILQDGKANIEVIDLLSNSNEVVRSIPLPPDFDFIPQNGEKNIEVIFTYDSSETEMLLPPEEHRKDVSGKKDVRERKWDGRKSETTNRFIDMTWRKGWRPILIMGPAAKGHALLWADKDFVVKRISMWNDSTMTWNHASEPLDFRPMSHDPFGFSKILINPDGNRLIASDWDDKKVRIFELDTAQVNNTIKPEYTPLSLAFDETGTRLAMGSPGGIIRFWETRAMETRHPEIENARALRSTVEMSMQEMLSPNNANTDEELIRKFEDYRFETVERTWARLLLLKKLTDRRRTRWLSQTLAQFDFGNKFQSKLSTWRFADYNPEEVTKALRILDAYQDPYYLHTLAQIEWSDDWILSALEIQTQLVEKIIKTEHSQDAIELMEARLALYENAVLIASDENAENWLNDIFMWLPFGDRLLPGLTQVYLALPAAERTRLLNYVDRNSAAIDLVQENLRQDKKNPYLWHLDAYLIWEQEAFDLKSALESQERAVQLAMDQGSPAIDPYDLGMIKEALDDYKKSLKQFPDLDQQQNP